MHLISSRAARACCLALAVSLGAVLAPSVGLGAQTATSTDVTEAVRQMTRGIPITRDRDSGQRVVYSVPMDTSRGDSVMARTAFSVSICKENDLKPHGGPNRGDKGSPCEQLSRPITYPVKVAVRVVVGRGPSDTRGVASTNWREATCTPDMHHCATNLVFRDVPVAGGGSHVNLVLSAVSGQAGGPDILELEGDCRKDDYHKCDPTGGPTTKGALNVVKNLGRPDVDRTSAKARGGRLGITNGQNSVDDHEAYAVDGLTLQPGDLVLAEGMTIVQSPNRFGHLYNVKLALEGQVGRPTYISPQNGQNCQPGNTCPISQVSTDGCWRGPKRTDMRVTMRIRGTDKDPGNPGYFTLADRFGSDEGGLRVRVYRGACL